MESSGDARRTRLDSAGGPGPRRVLLRQRFGPLLVAGGLFLAIEAVLRAALTLRSVRDLDVGPLLVARIFAVGLAYDVVAGLYALVPLALLLFVLPGRAGRRPLARGVVHATFVLTAFVVLFSALAEWFFWGEFRSRFNFIAVDYLVYTREVVQNIWESYPVAPLVAAILVIAALASWLARETFRASVEAPAPLPSRAAVVSCLAAVLGLSFAFVNDHATRVSDNRFAVELAKNGLYELFSAFRNNQLDYAPFYPARGEAASLTRLRGLLAEPNARFESDDPRDLARVVVPPGGAPERRANVVLVVVESLSASYLDSFGGIRHLTPNLDALAEKSLRFTRFYATGTRTVRGLEAISLSVPPTPGDSIVKRPDNAGLFTIATPFLERGYDTTFFYGGYGFFDNMNAFFGGNGFRVIDRASLAGDESGFANAWGVADEYVYTRVLREARRSHDAGRPFFSLVMTTSNHRPFTYPDGRVTRPSGSGREGAVEYTDWAIGDLLRRAESEPWFANTVFVIVADHCASSAGRTEIPVDKYRIPLLVYAPGIVQPAVVEKLASQIDLAPTLLGLLRFQYRTRFFGRDIATMAPESGRALLATYSELGYLREHDGEDRLMVLSPGRGAASFAVSPDGADERPVATAPHLLEEAIAYYESADYALRHGRERWLASAERD